MERPPIPTPKAHLGDLINILVDENRGRYEVDQVTAVHVMFSKANGWRVAYQCLRHDDFTFEHTQMESVIKSCGRRWYQLPDPKFWVNELVSYKYGFRDWTAGVIEEVTMEYRTLRWEIEYWFRGTEEPIKERDIGKVIERQFEPPRGADSNDQQTILGEPTGDL